MRTSTRPKIACSLAELSRIAPLALLLGFAACSDSSTDLPPHAIPAKLIGTWATEPEDSSPRGWYERHLVFGRNGRFSDEWRSYGVYDGQPRGEISAWSRTEGGYNVEGDRLVFEPERLVQWDRFYGDDSSETVHEPYPYGTIFDDARYELSKDELTIHYTTYPADAPVPTTMRLNRAD